MQPIYMIMIYYQDKKLKKRLYVLEVDIITMKKHWFDISSSKDVFQVTSIAPVWVINHYHINGLHFETPCIKNKAFKGFFVELFANVRCFGFYIKPSSRYSNM